MDEKNEKTFEEDEKKTPNGTNGENGDGAVEDEDEVKKMCTSMGGKENLTNLNISGENPDFNFADCRASCA